MSDQACSDAGGPVVALIDDLYFMSIIAGAARKAGVGVTFPRARQGLPPSARLVLVDLDCTRDWEAEIASYVAAGGVVIAFGPHLDVEKRKRARAAGCRRALAKSKFVRELPVLLADAARGSSDASRGERMAEPYSV